MSSITASKSILVDIKNVSLSFRADIYKENSMRELFVNAVSNPIKVLTKQKDRLPILNDISLQIYKGDRIGLLGVNGTGKTSLCRAIAGIYRPAKGSLSVEGKVRAIFDTTVGIHPELTGRENAELLAEFLYPEDHKQHKQMIAEALAFSELKGFVDTPFKNYSNGMQARLCLSMISCKPCDLLILDEVFDGADAFFREKISKRISKMIEESGGVIFVSHSFEQIKQVCNRLVVFQKGKIVYDGDVDKGIEAYLELNRNP